MAVAVPNNPCFHDEAAARRTFERSAWPAGPFCPHCGSAARCGRLGAKEPAIYKCYACRKTFTVRIGTILEGSHVPLHLWLRAIHLMSAGEQRIRPRAMEAVLRVTPKTAAALIFRIRHAMAAAGQPATAGSDAAARMPAPELAGHDANFAWLLACIVPPRGPGMPAQRSGRSARSAATRDSKHSVHNAGRLALTDSSSGAMPSCGGAGISRVTSS